MKDEEEKMEAQEKTETPTEGGRILPDLSGQIRLIPEGESFSPKAIANAEKRTIEATFSFKRTNDSKQRYEKTVTFDFSGVSMEKLLEMALYEAKQKVQGLLRSVNEEEMILAKTYRHVDVQAVIVAAEKKAGANKEYTDLAKQARAQGFTPERLKALMAAALAAEGKAPPSGGEAPVEAPQGPPKGRRQKAA